jgi:integrase
MLEQSACRSAGSLGTTISGLRALLRFSYLRGYTLLPLAAAVPAVAARPVEPSRTLSAGELGRLLAGCDRRTATGLRDYTILKVLVRLGLRAGEVAALTLDDVNWRTGELGVVAKGGRRDRLPLPVDVGQALADYLQHGQPHGESRHVFVHVRAPYCAMGRRAVSHVVVRACQRAGVPELRAHRLRHSAATEMHRAGAGLVEIGQVLRHCHTTTTTIYTRTDPHALTGLARPWPRRRRDMNDLRQAVADYLAIRHALGFQLRGYDRLLGDLIDDLQRAGAPTLTTDLAVAWATKPTDAQPFRWKTRLSVARATYRRSIRPRRHRPATCSPTGARARCLTSTPRARSTHSSTRPTHCSRRCARRRTARCWGCWR